MAVTQISILLIIIILMHSHMHMKHNYNFAWTGETNIAWIWQHLVSEMILLIGLPVSLYSCAVCLCCVDCSSNRRSSHSDVFLICQPTKHSRYGNVHGQLPPSDPDNHYLVWIHRTKAGNSSSTGMISHFNCQRTVDLNAIIIIFV